VASFLEGVMVELRGVAELVVDAGAVVPGKAAAAALTAGVVVEGMRGAEGTKGLASTLRADLIAAVGGTKGDGFVDRGKFGESSAVLLTGLKTEEACEAGMEVSDGMDLVREALAMEGVLVIGVVVCESGVEPGGVWRTESRKENVWETGLRLSPVISARLPLTSPVKVLLPAALVAKLILGSSLLVETFSSFAFCPFLPDTG